MIAFLNQYGAVYCVAVLCGLEILAKGILSHTYRRLLKSATDMGRSEHRLMKSIRVKFETCYKLKIGVSNVEIFIEKYLQHYRTLGLHLKTWEAFCNQCMILSMIASLGGGILAIANDLNKDIIFLSLFSGVIGNGILLLFDCLYGIANKREMLKTDMMDFLDNMFKPRLENETFHTQMMEKYQQEYFSDETEQVEADVDSGPSKVVSLIPKEKEKAIDTSIEFTKEEEDVIREVLRTYMG